MPIYKRFDFFFFQVFLIFSWFNATITTYSILQHVLFIDRIYCFFVFCLLFTQSRETIYDPPCLEFILWHLQYYKWKHWCFQSNSISTEKLFKKFFNNLICFVLNHDFYFIPFWMHYTVFILTFKRNKISYFC